MARVVVVCVDRDDDLGKKAHIKGPIIGREANIEAAKKLLLADPSEADGNAIFDAVKTAEEIKAIDVATLTGHRERGYKADTEIRKQLDKLIAKYQNLGGIYLVTNGKDDDQLLPVLQSRVKVLGKKTSVVKEAKSLQSGYYVLREFIKDPNISRILFGLPGLILLITALFQDMGLKLIVLFIGLYLVLKGFGIEDAMFKSARSFRKTTSLARATFPLYIGAALLLILALWGGYEKTNVLQKTSALIIGATFIEGFISLFATSVILFFLGRIGDRYYRKEPRKIKRYAMSIVTVIAMWLVITKACDLIFGRTSFEEFLAIILLISLGTVLAITAIRLTYVRRYILSRLMKGMDVFDKEGNKIGALVEIGKKEKQILVQTSENKRHPLPLARVIFANPDENFAIVKL